MLALYDNFINQITNNSYHTYPVKDMYIEVPGFNESNLEVNLEGYYIHIKGKNDSKSIDRYYQLDSRIDPEKISASIQDGILTIYLTEKEKMKRNLLECKN